MPTVPDLRRRRPGDWYNPKSRFKEDIERARAEKIPWYEVLAKPGLRFGRTYPNLDPKGYRTLFLFELAERYYRKHGLMALLDGPTNAAQIFPEPELLIRLESGQLDAAVFYRHEVVAHTLPFLDLPDEVNQSNARFASLYREHSYTTDRGMTMIGTPILFTITIPSTVRNPAGAFAFVGFVLSREGRVTLQQHGLRPAPVLAGGATPSSDVRSASTTRRQTGSGDRGGRPLQHVLHA